LLLNETGFCLTLKKPGFVSDLSNPISSCIIFADMPDSIYSNDSVTFVRQGGTPVTIVRHGGLYVRVISYGGKPVTFVKYGGTPVTVDREASLPQEIQEEIGY
jgi:hypothetical protein